MNVSNQTTVDDDFSSTTEGDFEPEDVLQQEQQNNSDDDENAQPTLASSQQQQHMTEMNVAALNARVHWLEKQLLMEKLKVAEANKEKAEAEKVGLKARLEMMEQQKQQMEANNSNRNAGDDQLLLFLDKKFSELGTMLADKLLTQLQSVFCTFKQDIEKRLVDKLDKQEAGVGAENVLKLADQNKQLLKEWLTSGMLRDVSLVRVASNELTTFGGGWTIQQDQDGRAKKIAGAHRCGVRAKKAFPAVAGASSSTDVQQQLLLYFEVTVIEAKEFSHMYIGLCDANFPFTSSSTHVGAVAGSFAIRKYGSHWVSGKCVGGHDQEGFASGDVVGCGLLILSTERCIFFTKNGEIWGKPFLLGPVDAKADDIYPIVTTDEDGDEVEFNLGADLEASPFRYPLAHLKVVDNYD